MLSNRESARRSRRRKLEHLSTLEQQLNAVTASHDEVSARLADVEARYETALRDCAALRAEVDRLQGLLQPGSRAGASGATEATRPLPRPGSLQLLTESAAQAAASGEPPAKRPKGESPEVGGGAGGGEAPRGFVPFRSLKSYENLLSLQQQRSSAATPAAPAEPAPGGNKAQSPTGDAEPSPSASPKTGDEENDDDDEEQEEQEEGQEEGAKAEQEAEPAAEPAAAAAAEAVPATGGEE
mmetsp:Transcript_6048/g.21201  ORF Transcript_6048/g.21201 Transcript_6048/m.21201 type:complete len:240 (-) Transcript_6048:176-895(-)